MSMDDGSLIKISGNTFHTYYHRLAMVLAKNRKFVRLIKNGYRVKNVKFLHDLELGNSDIKITQRYALITVAKGDELRGVFVDVVNGRTLEVFNVRKVK